MGDYRQRRTYHTILNFTGNEAYVTLNVQFPSSEIICMQAIATSSGLDDADQLGSDGKTEIFYITSDLIQNDTLCVLQQDSGITAPCNVQYDTRYTTPQPIQSTYKFELFNIDETVVNYTGDIIIVLKIIGSDV